jgi:hypothetical protein
MYVLMGLFMPAVAAVLLVPCCVVCGMRAALLAPVRTCCRTARGRRRAWTACRDPADARRHEQLAEATCIAAEKYRLKYKLTWKSWMSTSPTSRRRDREIIIFALRLFTTIHSNLEDISLLIQSYIRKSVTNLYLFSAVDSEDCCIISRRWLPLLQEASTISSVSTRRTN